MKKRKQTFQQFLCARSLSTRLIPLKIIVFPPVCPFSFCLEISCYKTATSPVCQNTSKLKISPTFITPKAFPPHFATFHDWQAVLPCFANVHCQTESVVLSRSFYLFYDVPRVYNRNVDNKVYWHLCGNRFCLILGFNNFAWVPTLAKQK